MLAIFGNLIIIKSLEITFSRIARNKECIYKLTRSEAIAQNSVMLSIHHAVMLTIGKTTHTSTSTMGIEASSDNLSKLNRLNSILSRSNARNQTD